jgi:hypothetical protein
VVTDEQHSAPRLPRRGGLVAAVTVGIAAAVGVGVSTVGAGGAAPTTPTPAPSASSAPNNPSSSGRPASTSPPPSLVPAATAGPPSITRATAADLQWTRAAGFLTCSGLQINVRARTTGEVDQVLALLLRVSGGATTTLSLSGSGGEWSSSSLELTAPSVWRIRVVAIGPGGRDERYADITAPDDSRTTLRHVCPD